MNSKILKLETFTIKTPADGGDYQLSLGDQTVTAQTLRYGVIKLFNMAGVIPGGTAGVEYQLLDIIQETPPSRQKDWLLSILGNKIPEFPSDISPEDLQQASNQQESPDNPSSTESPTDGIVTISATPARVPYHRHSQSTIYDSIVNKAIADGGSLRIIQANLERQGILISHMTISRRLKGMKQ